MRYFILSITGIVLLAIGYSFIESDNNKKQFVEITSVKSGTIINKLMVIGRVASEKKTIVRSKIGARVISISLEEGDYVKKGEELIKFDDLDLKKKYMDNKIELKKAEIKLNKTTSKMNTRKEVFTDPSEKSLFLLDKQTKYSKVKISLETAGRELETAKELFKINAVSLVEVKRKEDIVKKLKKELVMSEKELDKAKEHVSKKEKTSINITSNKTEYDIALLEKELINKKIWYLEEQLKRLIVTIPHNGTVIKKHVDEGMVLTKGQAIFTVADLEDLKVIAEVDEADMGSVELEQPAVITSDAYPSITFEGYVAKIAPQAEIEKNHTFINVIIKLKNPSPLLKIGNQVDIEILTKKRESSLYIDTSALIEEDNDTFVWLYQDGKAKKIKINKGLVTIDKAEILNGLKENDSVIIQRNIILKENEHVIAN